MSSKVLKAIEDVQKAAQADSKGSGQAHVDLLESIRKLTMAAETPAERLMRMRFEPLQNAAIRMAIEAGVLEAIGAKKGEPINAQELSKATGYDALLIVRIMRIVTFTGVVDEAGESQYAANDVTYLINTPAMTGAEKHHFDLFFPVGAKLVEYMRETGVHQAPKNEEQKSPFRYAWNMHFWEFMESNAEHHRYFADYMAGRRTGLATWHETFPMATHLGPGLKQESGAVLLVDVGGSTGHELSSFHNAHPEVAGRLILQDQPSMIEKASKEEASANFELMAYDFFTPQPVHGARAYFFRNICHNWHDDACEKLLTNTAKSMVKGYSRLLIDDYVLPDTNATLRGSSMDFLMMCYVSGIERTKRQWTDLLDRCGLEIVKIWSTRSDYEQVIETQLKA